MARFPIISVLIILSLIINLIPINVLAEEKSYRVGYVENFYPFQTRKGSEPEGFVVELLETIARIEAVKFTYYPMSLNEAILALSAGQIDAIAGLKYTAELDEKFDFSEPFTTVSHSLIVSTDNQNIKTLPDLGRKVVAVERGDEGINILRDIRRINVIVANNQEEAFTLLQMGRADAFLGNTIFAKAYIRNNNLENRFKLIDEMLSPSDYALATSEGNKELLRIINTGLIKLRAKQEYQTIYNNWFGWENSELAKRLRITIIVLVISLFLVLIYVFFTMRWNTRLKQEVYNRTIELEKANILLKQKIEEEKRLRSKLVYKEKMQTLGQLVAGIAHELRNPLTSIKAFVELIPVKFANERFRKEIVTYLPAEINRLNKLVTHLLDYAKPQEPKKTNFQIKECIESVSTLFQVEYKKKNISFKTEIDSGHYAYADYGQIKQVIINLLLNASDSIENQGEIKISSIIESDSVNIIIEDTGKGIQAEKIPLVIEPFYTDKKDGTGLGLSLSLQLMKENDGDLLIESEAGVGTKVTMILPKGVAADEKHQSSFGNR